MGLTTIRSALQALQLCEQLIDSSGIPLTKKDKSCRAGLSQFVQNWMWKLTYDPNFIQSEKKAKKLGQGAVSQMRQLCSLIPFSGSHFDFSMERSAKKNFWSNATVPFALADSLMLIMYTRGLFRP